MAQDLKFDHEINEFTESCLEDIRRVNDEIKHLEGKISEFDNIGKFNKLFHSGQIKAELEKLQTTLENTKIKLSQFQQELEMYQTYGKDIPKDMPNYDELSKMMQNRINKLDIIVMIDMGMM